MYKGSVASLIENPASRVGELAEYFVEAIQECL